MSQQTNDESIAAQTSKSVSESSHPNATTIATSSNYLEEKDVATSVSDANNSAITKSECSRQLTDECCANKHQNRLKTLYKCSLTGRKRKLSREASDTRKYNGLVMGLNKCKKAKCRNLNAICKHDIKFFIRNARIPSVLDQNIAQKSAILTASFLNDSSSALREMYNTESDKIKFHNLHANDIPLCYRDVRAQEIISSNENHLYKNSNMFSLPITTCDDLLNKNSKKSRDRACYMSFVSLAIVLFLIVSYFGVLLFLRITSVPFDE